ncbi:hypothetical protein BDU57DRAFT_160340 [Ampelomyces quisqualis]|uniref:RING-type domain-containing protein n=1 Tax=Ampelomyces quisqualis TaxID=50730 RepID=A0A6A5QPH1_AMPQU|nr:hypothetical protein BDU57DRAFT_160340 [Ampelomyces quisqualis]
MATVTLHRHIDGVDARFTAGYELLDLNFNSNMRLTNRVSVKVDANSILIFKYPAGSTIERIKQYTGGKIQSARQGKLEDGRLWHENRMIRYKQPEEALQALKRLNSRAGFECQALYTVFFFAAKEIVNAVHGQLEHAAQTDGLFLEQELRQDEQILVRLTGLQQHAVAKVKQTFESIFQGYHLAVEEEELLRPGYSEMWDESFSTHAGKDWLQKFSRAQDCVVLGDKIHQRVRFYLPHDEYGDWRSILFWAKEKMREKLHGLKPSPSPEARQEKHIIEFDRSTFQNVLANGIYGEIRKRLDEWRVSTRPSSQTRGMTQVVFKCQRELVIQLAEDFGLPSPRLDVPEHAQCTQCEQAPAKLTLSACKHTICKNCFNRHLEAESTGSNTVPFRVLCFHEDCQAPIDLDDMRRYATDDTNKALQRVSIARTVRTHPSLYRLCRKPSCQSVYQTDSSFEIFMCSTCLTQTCTRCGDEPHVDWTCAEYKQVKPNLKLMRHYIIRGDTRLCPSCEQNLQNPKQDCYVQCSRCHVHIWWQCMATFTPSVEQYRLLSLVQRGLRPITTVLHSPVGQP